jgi:hypothetical protein
MSHVTFHALSQLSTCLTPCCIVAAACEQRTFQLCHGLSGAVPYFLSATRCLRGTRWAACATGDADCWGDTFPAPCRRYVTEHQYLGWPLPNYACRWEC